MDDKRLIGVSEAMRNLLPGENKNPDVNFVISGEEYQEVDCTVVGYPCQGFPEYPNLYIPTDLQTIYADDFQHSYRQGFASAQAKEDVKQVNETVVEMVEIGLDGRLVLRRSSRNNRWRDVALTLDDNHFRVQIYTNEEQEDEIVKVNFCVNSREQEAFFRKREIIGGKLLRELKYQGVRFSTNLGNQRQAEAINSFILQLAANQQPEVVPKLHGWYEKGGKKQFCMNELTWQNLLKRCRF